ncbi:MAG TPA: YbjN domain-containing protein [Chloroflexota bacterium]|nr:YbjN domain-containing protein [Chloroflexota bacterium]
MAEPALRPPEKAPAPKPSTWRDVEVGLTSVIGRMATPTHLIISAPGTESRAGEFQGAEYYVQFAQGGDEGFRAEAVSNNFLAGDSRLTPAQERRMTDLGWLRYSSPPMKGSPNWYREWAQPPPTRQIAKLAVETLHDVYGIRTPSLLRYRCWDGEGRSIALAALRIDPEPESTAVVMRREGQHPPQASDLTGLIDDAIRAVTHSDRVTRDRDGDVPVVFGSVTVFVRELQDPSRVRIFAPLLWGVEESEELLKAVNAINLQTLYGRAIWTGREVLMVIDVPAHGITVEALSFACFSVGSAADHFDDLLRGTFGGRSMLKPDA